MKALTRPKITATTKMMPTRCRRVSPPTKLSPWTTWVTTHSANPVTAARMTTAPMRVNLLPDADEMPDYSGVSTPPSATPRLGPQVPGTDGIDIFARAPLPSGHSADEGDVIDDVRWRRCSA